MIGHILDLSNDGPVRNVSITSTSGEIESSISEPQGPVAIDSVISMSIRGTRLGRLFIFLAAVLSLMLVMLAVRNGGEWIAAFVIAVIATVFLIVHGRRLTLYSVTLITRNADRTRVVFYRTFCAFDLALMLDWLTFKVGDVPRELLGSFKPRNPWELEDNHEPRF